MSSTSSLFAASDNLALRGSSSSSDTVSPVSPVGSTQISEVVEDEIGPYDPLGVRVGRFLFYPSVTFWGTFTDNIDLSEDRQTGRVGSTDLDVTIQSDWSRHSLKVEGAASMSGYQTPNRKPENEESLGGELRLDLSDGTELTITGSASRAIEDRDSVDLDQSGGSANYLTNLHSGARLQRQAGRLLLQLRGSIDRSNYENDSSRDYNTYGAGGRVGVSLTDQVMPFVDVEMNRKRFDEDTNTQSGDTLRGAIGIALTNREDLSGEASVGAMVWKPDASATDNDKSLFVDASLAWSPNTLWTFRGGYTTEMSSSATDATSVRTRTVSLSADYAVLRNLVLSAEGSAAHETYNGISRKDWVLDATFNATYSFNRYAQLIVSAGHQRRDSSEEGSDYEANKIRIGLKLQR
ncbi:outer membrane beta-barrel protein [uncultured Cohaesibacter sp.]|uniref:outer membrane beta-barrel protein n=1 Tax=uncultured Cohaesibacter sp. TaxID=1002546 RepID=UPI0029311B54|nr:outer membrane beta-barrel protein [uncultured Cohaesibacter sp.]